MGALVSRISEKYGVRFIGFYDIPGADNVHVFYQPHPDIEKGHSHYLGVVVNIFNGIITLLNAKSILDARYPAIGTPDGKITCSRFRHDYVESGDHAFLDGGLAYTRFNPDYPPNGYIVIEDDHEVFVPRPPLIEG